MIKMDLERLSEYFHMPINDVSKELGICTTVLKKICRNLGIPRWPHRKIKSIDKKIQAIEAIIPKNPEEEKQLKEEIRLLKERKASLLRNPSKLGKRMPKKSELAAKKDQPSNLLSNIPVMGFPPLSPPHSAGSLVPVLSPSSITTTPTSFLSRPTAPGILTSSSSSSSSSSSPGSCGSPVISHPIPQPISLCDVSGSLKLPPINISDSSEQTPSLSAAGAPKLSPLEPLADPHTQTGAKNNDLKLSSSPALFSMPHKPINRDDFAPLELLSALVLAAQATTNPSTISSTSPSLASSDMSLSGSVPRLSLSTPLTVSPERTPAS